MDIGKLDDPNHKNDHDAQQQQQGNDADWYDKWETNGNELYGLKGGKTRPKGQFNGYCSFLVTSGATRRNSVEAIPFVKGKGKFLLSPSRGPLEPKRKL